MEPFERKYNNEHWQAIYDAKFARGLSYRRIAELAKTGELGPEPFEISALYVGEMCRKEKRRRQGKNRSPLVNLDPKDSTEEMRIRLLSLWDSERLAVEREKEGKRDLARLEQLAKLSLAIARIPGPKDPTPKNPATKDAEGKRGPELRGGAAGALISALRGADNAIRAQDRVNTPTPEPEGEAEPETQGAHGSRTSARTELDAA